MTRAHGDSTGAPYYFAQVTFHEVKAGNYFLGGLPLECDQIFVHGTIREGRPREMKDALMERLAREGQLMAYRHTGFWQCMDTLRDRRLLEDLWESGKAPWKTWS